MDRRKILSPNQEIEEVMKIALAQASELPDYSEVEDGHLTAKLDRINKVPPAGATLKPNDIPKISEPIEAIDHKLIQEKKNRTQGHNKLYNKFVEARSDLPVNREMDKVLHAISNNRVTLVRGMTGCGKSTQIPQMVLEDAISKGRGSTVKIVVTQPRKIAAVSLAKRVIDEFGEGQDLLSDDLVGHVDRSIGYQIRFDEKSPNARGSIEYVTSGIVLRRLEDDPLLEGVSHLFIDEVHERQAITDFLVTVARRILMHRADFKVVLMSATMDEKQFGDYFDEKFPGEVGILDVPGSLHEVRVMYLEDVLTEMLPGFDFGPVDRFMRFPFPRNFDAVIKPRLNEYLTVNRYPLKVRHQLLRKSSEAFNVDLVIHVILNIVSGDPEGGILVFVNGSVPMEAIHDKLYKDERLEIYLLHSQFGTDENEAAFNPVTPGKTKLVVATNIAEASITIDDIVYVIDTGVANVRHYKYETNSDKRNTEWISKSSAEQRKGRAGRVRAGTCIRLYTRTRYESFAEEPVPEIKRLRLEEEVLLVKKLGLGRPQVFLASTIDPPGLQEVEATVRHLIDIGAFDEEENLTILGYHMADLPIDCQLSKLLLYASVLGCQLPAARVASVLDNKMPFSIKNVEGETRAERHFKLKIQKMIWDKQRNSDHLLAEDIARAWEEHVTNDTDFEYADYVAAKTLADNRKIEQQVIKDLIKLKFVPFEDNEDDNRNLLMAVMAAAFRPNLLQSDMKMDKRRTYLVVRDNAGQEFQAHKNSVCYDASFVRDPVTFYKKQLIDDRNWGDITDMTKVPLLAVGLLGGYFRDEEVHLVRFPEETGWIYRFFRAEVERAVEFRLSNPGKCGDRDSIILSALATVLSMSDEAV